MNIDAVALVDVLKSEKKSYQELLQLAERQQELLIQRDIEGLSEVLRATEKLIVRVRDLEARRLTLLDADSNEGSSQPPRTLLSLIDYLDDETAMEAAQLRDEILALVEDLSVANNINAELVHRSIGYVDFLLDTLANDDSLCYGHRDISQNSKPWLFDGRA